MRVFGVGLWVAFAVLVAASCSAGQHVGAAPTPVGSAQSSGADPAGSPTGSGSATGAGAPSPGAAGSVTASGTVSPTATATVRPPPPPPPPPASDPDLGAVVPARYTLVSRARATLSAERPDQAEIVVSRGPLTGPAIPVAGQDSTEDVQLLTWDPDLRRWNLTFDAQTMTVQPEQASNDYASEDPQRILGPDHPVSGVTARTVTLSPGHTVLLLSGTDNQTQDVALQRTALISVNDGLAHQDFYTALADGRPPAVTGPADSQQVTLTARYTSVADPASSPVRDFTQTVGWSQRPLRDGHGHVGVLTDDRPGIGLTLAVPAGAATDVPPIVAAVRPGSPAALAGVHPGERLEEITPATAQPADRALLGPDVVDELAAHHTGDRVTLHLRRDEDARTVTVTTVKIQDVAAGPGGPVPGAAQIGITVDPYGEVLGAAIASITPGSPAARARLAVGDTITRVGAVPVEDGDSLQAALLGTAGERTPVQVTASDSTTDTLYITPTSADPGGAGVTAYVV